MFRLKCKAQNYAWGKPCADSLVAQLLFTSQEQQPTATQQQDRFAELWMGTHPSAPSLIAENLSVEKNNNNNNTETTLPSLKELLTPANLGRSHQATFGRTHVDLPYLFKVLSIDKALSIQSHPDKKLAEELHKKDPAHYPDDNHKPELVVALTPFQALCCFRKVNEIVWFLEHIPELAKITGYSATTTNAAPKDDGDDHSTTAAAFLRPLLSKLYAAPQDENASLQKQFLEASSSSSSKPIASGDEKMVPLFSRAVAAFKQVSEQFPGDVGLWMVFFLNVLDLQPGDGLFLAANEPHAYLAGDCVEIMAASDNVIRAGLTPKFKDVEILLSSLTYKTDSLEHSKFNADSKLPVQSYVPPSIIKEFRLDRVTCAKQQQQQQQAPSKIRIPLHSAAIFIVLNSDSSSSAAGNDLARVSRIVTEEDGKVVSSSVSSVIKKGDIDAILLESDSSKRTFLEFENLSSQEDLVCFVAQTRGDGNALLTSKI